MLFFLTFTLGYAVSGSDDPYSPRAGVREFVTSDYQSTFTALSGDEAKQMALKEIRARATHLQSKTAVYADTIYVQRVELYRGEKINLERPNLKA